MAEEKLAEADPNRTQEQENILHAAVESARQKLDQARLRLAEHNKAHHGEQVD